MTKDKFKDLVSFRVEEITDGYAIQITASITAKALGTTYTKYQGSLEPSTERRMKKELIEHLWRFFYEDRRQQFAQKMSEFILNSEPVPGMTVDTWMKLRDELGGLASAQ